MYIFWGKIFNCLMQHFSGGLGTRLTFEMPLHCQPLVASYINTLDWRPTPPVSCSLFFRLCSRDSSFVSLPLSLQVYLLYVLSILVLARYIVFLDKFCISCHSYLSLVPYILQNYTEKTKLLLWPNMGVSSFSLLLPRMS